MFYSLLPATIYEQYLLSKLDNGKSPFCRSFLIAYSKQEDFSRYSLALINFYIREIIGWYYPELIRDDIQNITESRVTGEYKYSITSWMTLY